MRALLFVAAVLIAAGAAPARAQEYQDLVAGYPIRSLSVTLSAGVQYEFETRNLVTPTAGIDTNGDGIADLFSYGADTVITLRSATAGAGTASTGGADVCGTDVFRSCFVTPTALAAGGTYYLTVRAWDEGWFGTAEVRYRPVGGAWTSLGTISFGGSTYAPTIASGTTAVRFETAHLPGTNLFHYLAIVPPGRPIWDIQYVANSNSSRVTGAAAIDIANATTSGLVGASRLIIGSAASGTTGSIRAIVNVRASSLDYDQDGLSMAVEAALGTCDRPNQAILPSGFNCANVGTRGENVCAAYPSFPTTEARVICQSALRDSDHDGYRDDLEALGYGGFRLAQWGARPNHMDVFIELDANDQDTTTPFCEGFAPIPTTPPPLPNLTNRGAVDQIGSAEGPQDNLQTLSPSFFDMFENFYGRLPATYNPDGTAGLDFHFDVGIAPPDPVGETRYGSWGGGGTCIATTDGNPDPAVWGGVSCAYDDVFANSDSCPFLAGSSVVPAATPRRWIFRWGIDYGIGGQGGQTNGFVFGTGDTAEHTHEMGHVLTLEHAGPQGSLANDSRSSRGIGDTRRIVVGSERANFLSLMNYMFFRVHGSDGTGLPDTRAGFLRHGFSDGSRGIFDFHEMSEEAPWSGLTNDDLWQLEWFPAGFTAPYPYAVARVDDTPSGSANVDWNRDGVMSGVRRVASDPANDSNARALARTRMIANYAEPTVRRHGVSPNGAAIIGNALVVAVRECDAGSSLCHARLYADVNGDCNVQPIVPYTPCPDAGPTTVECGPYPGCFSHGSSLGLTPTDPGVDSIALARIAPPSGERLAVAFRRSGTIRVGSGVLATGAGPVGIAWSTAPTYFPTTASPHTTHSEFGMTALSAENVLVVYTDSALTIRQMTVNAVTGGSALTQALNTSGAIIQTNGPPGLTTDGTRILMGVFPRNGLAVPDRTDIYERVASTGRWAFLVSVPSAAWTGPPVLAPAREPGEVAMRLNVFLRLATGNTTWDETVETRPWVWRSAQLGSADLTAGATFEPFELGHTTGLAAIFDDRLVFTGSLTDLRVYSVEFNGVDPDGSTAGGAAPNGDEYLRSGIVLSPFSVAGDPTLTVDYDEWLAMSWGACHGRNLHGFNILEDGTVIYQPPTTTLGGVIPTPYNYPVSSFEACGPRPRYFEVIPEGTGGGSGASTALVTLGPSDTSAGRWPGAPTTYNCNTAEH